MTFDETEWSLRRTGLGIESDTGSAPSFWLLLKRSALSFVFLAILDFHRPRMLTARMLSFQIGGLLLVVLLGWLLMRRQILGKSRRPVREPPLGIMVGFPSALTLLVIDQDLFKANAGGVVPIREIVLLNAAVILPYALFTRIFLWKGKVDLAPLPVPVGYGRLIILAVLGVALVWFGAHNFRAHRVNSLFVALGALFFTQGVYRIYTLQKFRDKIRDGQD